MTSVEVGLPAWPNGSGAGAWYLEDYAYYPADPAPEIAPASSSAWSNSAARQLLFPSEFDEEVVSEPELVMAAA